MKGEQKIEVAFLWHMHQPDYRDRERKRILLPWVRLHGLKDYYDMPARLARYPEVHQTFNLVPSLIEQIECYASGGWEEDELELFKVPAQDLSDNQKHRILDDFFRSPEEQMIRPHARYHSLLRDKHLHGAGEILRIWNPQDWRDLQVWRQLAWIDKTILDRDAILSGLIAQERDYSEDQKGVLLERMLHWLSETVNVYRDLQDDGILELSTTPYYHPILPLLIDPASVHESMPDCPLPDPTGNHPEDARVQLQRALDFHEGRFGKRPKGVWPSEGSVSQETAALLGELGALWFATGEDILAASLGRPVRKGDRATEDLYKPYQTLGGKGPIVVFRDQRLSDLIGFEYSKWDAEKAADHFINQVLAIGKGWTGEEPPLVSVILDGENCWEHYAEDGGPFLDALYERLQTNSAIHCSTLSEALEHRHPVPLERLSAGSWINGNFAIWMGDEADRTAWGLLEETRRTLVEQQESGTVNEEVLAEAWEEIYTAEGSDWFWWFGDSNSSEQDALFDEMFRLHLMRVHTLLGLEPPPRLQSPIETRPPLGSDNPDPKLPAPPLIDGRESHYYEWRGAVCYEPGRQSGAMQRIGENVIQKVYYGLNADRFYLRADSMRPTWEGEPEWRWEIRISSPCQLRLRYTRQKEGFLIERATNGENGQWTPVPKEQATAAEEAVFEAAIGLDMLAPGEGNTLSFHIGCPAGSAGVEWTPPLSSFSLTLPGKPCAGLLWFP